MTTLTNYNTGAQVSSDQLDTFEQTCDTFADLRAFVGTTGIQVFARGQSVPNDGLGGAFWWNDGSTAPDDNLNVIVPSGALAGAWNRIVVPAGVVYSFNAQFMAWMASLPTTPPAGAGHPWNNDGTPCVSK